MTIPSPAPVAGLSWRPITADDVAGWPRLGGVDPAWRGRGIGRALLAWQEQVGRAKIAAASTSARGRLLVHLDDHVAAARRLVERAGFRQLRVFLELSRPLSAELPTAPLDTGLRITGYTPALSEPVREAHNEAFVDHWGSEPRSRADSERTLAGRHFRPDWSFVVLAGDEVAGYALTSAYRAEDRKSTRLNSSHVA